MFVCLYARLQYIAFQSKNMKCILKCHLSMFENSSIKIDDVHECQSSLEISLTKIRPQQLTDYKESNAHNSYSMMWIDCLCAVSRYLCPFATCYLIWMSERVHWTCSSGTNSIGLLTKIHWNVQYFAMCSIQVLILIIACMRVNWMEYTFTTRVFFRHCTHNKIEMR